MASARVRIAGVDEVLGRLDGEPVHHLQAGGDHARGDDRPHRIPRLAHVVEGGQQGLGLLGQGEQAQGGLDDHPQHALGAGHQGEQIVARGIQGLAAQGEALAGDGDHLELEDVVHRQAVLEAVHAAGVFRHVAADGAGDLGGGVRGIVQPVGGRRLGHGQVAHAGLDPGRAVARVDVEDRLELGQAQHHRIVPGQGAAGQARAGAPGDHRHLARVAQAHDRLDLGHRVGQRHGQGQAPVGGQPVALVGAQVLFAWRRPSAGSTWRSASISAPLAGAAGADGLDCSTAMVGRVFVVPVGWVPIVDKSAPRHNRGGPLPVIPAKKRGYCHGPWKFMRDNGFPA